MSRDVRTMSGIASTMRDLLASYVANLDAPEALTSSPSFTLDHALADTPTIRRLVEGFGLTTFERDLLLLCAAAELDAEIDTLCAAAQKNVRRAFPTFTLALTLFGDECWESIAPTAPLRKWRLIDVRQGDTLTTSPLRIDERILHYLLGTSAIDKRIADLVLPLEATTEPLPTQRALAGRIAMALAGVAGSAPVIQLFGLDVEGMIAVGAALVETSGTPIYALAGTNVPVTTDEQLGIALLWGRESLLGSGILIIDSTDGGPTEPEAISSLIERMHVPIILLGRVPLPLPRRPSLAFEVAIPSAEEQKTIWQEMLSGIVAIEDADITSILSQFNLTIGQIQAAAKEVADAVSVQPETELSPLLWSACRRQSRRHLANLAHRIEPRSDWDDLVLNEQQKQTLHQIAMHVRRRTRVYEEWGFASKRSRGLGTTALFAGASGTGKTMAAEVLANELKLDLYQIDLSQIVSKYIGETEKNLRRIFDAADESGAILLFDEADSLFGKRSEVKDSHDRYANLEVSYLLQRMESYRGLAILTTNMKQALDPAFLRRIRFIVNFPFPEPGERAEIWWKTIPTSTPTQGLDFAKLASLNISGGSIWNIALNAAFLAAECDEPLKMRHMLLAARSEYAKLEKPLTDAEIRGWI